MSDNCESMKEQRAMVRRILWLCVLTCASALPAGAMPLTTVQLQALKAAIQSEQACQSAARLADGSFTADGALACAAAFNVSASPDFWVWRSSVGEDEIVGTTTEDGTTWSWTAYIARSQGERDGWREMFTGGFGFIDPSKANVRQGLADIFSGSTNSAPSQRTHLLTVGRRRAKKGEKLFATGTGSTASPATMAVEGDVTADNVTTALNLQ